MSEYTALVLFAVMNIRIIVFDNELDRCWESVPYSLEFSVECASISLVCQYIFLNFLDRESCKTCVKFLRLVHTCEVVKQADEACANV